MVDRPHDIATRAVHAGQPHDAGTGAVIPPIVLSSTFRQHEPGVEDGFVYARSNNPTRQMLEACLASLEEGKHGLAFASGCAAIATVLQTLPPGGHLIACDDVYGGTARLIDRVYAPLGLQTSWVDLTNLDAVAAAWRDNTQCVWVESPTNPLLKVVDLPQLIAFAHARGAKVVVDNTFATPVLQQPLALGADLVLHSTTKYINGHSDVIGGAVVTRDDGWASRLRFLQNAVGAVPSPFDCFLVLRGIKTLPLRMQRHNESALALATWLQQQPQVQRVLYPGLAEHPQHHLAASQMRGFGGMIACVLQGGMAEARQFLQGLRIFTLAESLGGVESLAEHPASMTHAALPPQRRVQLGIEDGLVRLSVGVEGVEDLRADLAQALAGISFSPNVLAHT